jgi:biotin-dependent carboxylase-like uncharacterized protein
VQALRIIEPGPLATIQDLGRYGYQDRGVPVSGAMDGFALRAGNLLVGNEQNDAAVEITLGGLRAEFLGDLHFAVTGGDFEARLNGEAISNWVSHIAGRGDVLTLDSVRFGCRGYLAVAGGIDVPLVMGSKSTYLRGGFGGLEGRALRRGDILGCGSAPWPPIPEIAADLLPKYRDQPVLRVVLGPQDDLITEEGVAAFFSSPYQVTERADRMGCVLSGPTISHNKGADIISDGTIGGAVQVPGNGQPIVLMADRQTIGGYVKIATVVSFDLPLLAQLLPGSMVRFTAVSVFEAREIHLKQEFMLRRYYERFRGAASHSRENQNE